MKTLIAIACLFVATPSHASYLTSFEPFGQNGHILTGSYPDTVQRAQFTAFYPHAAVNQVAAVPVANFRSAPILHTQQIHLKSAPLVAAPQLQFRSVPLIHTPQVQFKSAPVIQAPQVEFRSVAPVVSPQPQILTIQNPVVPIFRQAEPIKVQVNQPVHKKVSVVNRVYEIDSREVDDDDSLVVHSVQPKVQTYSAARMLPQPEAKITPIHSYTIDHSSEVDADDRTLVAAPYSAMSGWYRSSNFDDDDHDHFDD